MPRKRKSTIEPLEREVNFEGMFDTQDDELKRRIASNDSGESKKSFRVARKQFFFTYTHCPMSMEELLEYWSKGREIEKYLICEESHEDGNPHLHAYFHFKKKVESVNPHWADIEYKGCGKDKPGCCEETGSYHPNDAGAIRSHSAIEKYITKDGNWISNFYEDNVWNELQKATSVDSGMKTLLNRSPRDYFLYGGQIESNLRKKLKEEPKIYKPPEWDDKPFNNIPHELDLWFKTEAKKSHRARCLFLWGPTRLGKTAYVRQMIPNHVYWRGTINLDTFREDADVIIFDDINWKDLMFKKQWLTQMGECEVTDKYKPKTKVNIRMPAIFIANDDENDPNHGYGKLGIIDDSYWSKNLWFVHITEKLYSD